MKQLCKIEVPRVWLRLLHINQLAPETPTAKWRDPVAVTEPQAYRQDLRTVVGKYDDGWRAELQLCSGDENYWVEIDIFDADDHVRFSSDAQYSLAEGAMDIDSLDAPGRDVQVIFTGERETLSCTLTVTVTYDPAVTDPEALASAMDKLVETATSTPGILSEYGDPSLGEFLVGRDQ